MDQSCLLAIAPPVKYHGRVTTAKAPAGRVYAIRRVDDGSAVYVGQTVTPISVRWARHCVDAFERDSGLRIHRYMRSVGKEALFVQTLERTRVEDLNQREIFWIDKLKTLFWMGAGGMNVSPGGEQKGRGRIGKRKRRPNGRVAVLGAFGVQRSIPRPPSTPATKSAKQKRARGRLGNPPIADRFGADGFLVR